MSSWDSEDTGREELPESIGPYRVLRPLGSGGMGEVYLAERLEPRQLAAVKVVKLGMDTRSVLARFEIERQALAMMSHSTIARMLDAGMTERGQPWFAMEYVPGLPLTEYCAKKRLDIEARLRLFLQVCEGVQHAHQKGVIHRDLKPGNILVMEEDDEPVPKIIDFGLARAVDQTRWTHTLVAKEGKFRGTLPYMSPEQADEDYLDIDTRTDIYSLGVVLYELLTGEPPFTLAELEEAGKLGVLQILRDKEPQTPSQRVASANPTTRAHAEVLGLDLGALRRRVKGDLDCITSCALEKDRARRYPSVSALAANLRRYLRNEQVEPAPPGVWRRLRKWQRRHRRGFAVGALAGASLLSMAGIWAWKQLQYEEEQRRVILASDPALLREFVRQADEDLWPLGPELRGSLESWSTRATRLTARLPEHVHLLAELEATAVTGADSELEFRLRAQRAFVPRLREFSESPSGTMAGIARRLRDIEDLERRTISSPDAVRKWQECLAALEDSERYRGLQLDPMFGLLPIGPDPESGLWLFAHLQSGELPRRGEDGRIVVGEDTCVVFVLVPAGRFTMGRDEVGEGPPVSVRIEAFLMSKFEMTQAQWLRMSGHNPSNYQETFIPPGGPTHPVERVSLLDCVRYLRRFGMVLPTEGQWEFACRAGTEGDRFCAEKEIDRYVNLADQSAEGAGWPEIDLSLDDGHPVTAPVGSLSSNPWGFHDVLGNVWEWAANPWTENYEAGVRDGDGFPIGALDEEMEIGVWRGGCYSSDKSWCVAPARLPLSTTNREVHGGLRPVFPLDDVAQYSE